MTCLVDPLLLLFVSVLQSFGGEPVNSSWPLCLRESQFSAGSVFTLLFVWVPTYSGVLQVGLGPPAGRLGRQGDGSGRVAANGAASGVIS